MKHLLTETAEALTKFLLSIELQDFIMYEEAWQKLDACMQAFESSPHRHTYTNEEALEDANATYHMLTLYACHRDAIIMARRYSNADMPRTTKNPADFMPVVMDDIQDRCTWELDPIGVDELNEQQG